MQTLKIPYSTDVNGSEFISELRRVQSAAIRSAYVMAIGSDGLKRSEKNVRNALKERFSKVGILDSWALHCAAKVGISKRMLRPDGKIIFGSKAAFERRQKGLIDNATWRAKRLQPFVSYGDSQKPFGNQNVRLIDHDTVVVKIGRKDGVGRAGRTITKTAVLKLVQMRGNAGKIMQLLAEVAAHPKQDDRINLCFSIDDKSVSITFDPADLPTHPQRLEPVRVIEDRCLGIDLNPNFIGLSVSQCGKTTDLEDTALLDHALVQFDLSKESSSELVRETLAVVCDRAIALCRKWGVGQITLEKGLGKLRSSGRNRALNRLLNYWARTVFTAMLTRRANLAGTKVAEVWGGYSTTIGNLAFEAPDACASATEIARRGLAASRGTKDVLPGFRAGWVRGLRKDLDLPAEAVSWQDCHRKIKAAKIGYRRPHPSPKATGSGVPGFTPCGHAVVRLKHRHRPGILFQPMAMPWLGRYSNSRCGNDQLAVA